jgi:hypothetical protein
MSNDVPDPLDPLGTLETFTVNGWTVTIHQGVTGGLFWVATRGPERLHSHFPASFAVRDVKHFAIQDLKDRPADPYASHYRKPDQPT